MGTTGILSFMMMLIYLGVAIFLISLCVRLVRAVEKIAHHLEK